MWGAEAVIETSVQAFFALILAWMLCRDEKKLWILGLAFIPAIMDLDHLLPTYSMGIKAFHSIFFIYSISGIILAYGYLAGSETAKHLGVSSFAIFMMALSMDLLEGGRIAFLYPLSSQAYALPYFGAYQSSKLATIALLLMVVAGAFAYERSLYPKRERFRHGLHNHLHGVRTTLWNSFVSMNVGSESMSKVAAPIAFSLILYLYLISR